MKIVVSSGHGTKIRGAAGSPRPPQHDEVDQAIKMMNAVAAKLKAAGVEVVTYTDTVSTSQSENLDRIVDFHNAQTRDLDVSIHLNAFDHSAHGVEVLYVTQSSLASKVSAAIAEAGGFTNRGAKKRTDLAFLNGTEEPSILLECWFCDNTGDCQSADAKHDAIAEAIAESMSGYDVPDAEQPPDQELPPQPQPEPPTEDNRVDIVGWTEGDVAVVINGTLINGNARCRNVVRMRVNLSGDVVVSLNGEEFHNKPDEPDEPEVPSEIEPGEGIPENQKNITATVFGGEADNEYSAYGPYDSQGRGPYLNDTDYYVSLPVNVTDAAMRERGVRVFNPDNELSAVGPIMDKGPWVVNDDDYVFGDQRPIAETCYKNKTPLPPGSGNNAGKVPSNDAGIDLSPALADMLGIEGKGKVHWMFVSEDEDVA
jgi:N-acetylmuramoyl-L-alanine amidase